MLTSFAADNKVFPAIKAGALGYLLKDSSPSELIRAILQVHHGEPSLHPTIALQVVARDRAPAEFSPRPKRSRRAAMVLQLIAQGLSNQEIADRVAISESTVRAHVSRILAKLQIQPAAPRPRLCGAGRVDGRGDEGRGVVADKVLSWNLYAKHRTSNVSRVVFGGNVFATKNLAFALTTGSPFWYAMNSRKSDPPGCWRR
ncbi:response regulator transcription factor [Candidatus Amarobacter glycogenicus]|uniref:response regulator transcription factor n=1 Tax=Candidatus Amarobacter glycogenicus TaxID=3140699 RepID=UPI0031CC4468